MNTLLLLNVSLIDHSVTGELLCALTPPHMRTLTLKSCQKILDQGLVTDYHYLNLVLQRWVNLDFIPKPMTRRVLHFMWLKAIFFASLQLVPSSYLISWAQLQCLSSSCSWAVLYSFFLAGTTQCLMGDKTKCLKKK